MKKTLIAIAALAATGAFAQSAVTIRGSFDTGLVSYDMKGAKVTGIGSNIASTSAIFFEGTGDLGGGLKANFRYETGINTGSTLGNTGATSNVATGAVPQASTANVPAGSASNGAASLLGNGEVFVSLDGGFGGLILGTMNNLGLQATLTSQPFGTAIGSGFRSIQTSAANAGPAALVRNDNTFSYTTPSFSGVTGTWIARKQQVNSAASGNSSFNSSFGAQQQSQVSEVGLRYNKGPLNVIAARSMEDATNVMSVSGTTGATAAGNKGVLTSVSANYNLGALTIYGGVQAQKSGNGASVSQRDTSEFNLAAKYVMGVNAFMVNWGRLSGATTAANVAASNNASVSLIGFGYDYSLAKNATIVARYERIADHANFSGAGAIAATTGYNAIAGNNDRSRMGVAVKYNF